LLLVGHHFTLLVFYILTHIVGNTGAAANGNKKNARGVAGTRLARYVVVDQD
jgi:hypothetical protein